VASSPFPWDYRNKYPHYRGNYHPRVNLYRIYCIVLLAILDTGSVIGTSRDKFRNIKSPSNHNLSMFTNIKNPLIFLNIRYWQILSLGVWSHEFCLCAGHIRLPARALYCHVTGERSQGRRAEKWMENIKEDFELRNLQFKDADAVASCKDRTTWRQLISSTSTS